MTQEPLHILFVEDLPEDQEMAERYLRKDGLEFVWIRVDTEPEYIAALENFKPDLIISDYSMPEFDGMQALKIAQTTHPEIPVVILTGSINEMTAVTCMKTGAADYVIKEHLNRLPLAVRETLKREEVRREKAQIDRELQESVTRYRSLFEDSPVSIWEEDFSKVKQQIDQLKADGITDFETYIKNHPNLAIELMGLVNVTDVNRAAIVLYGAKNKEEFLHTLNELVPKNNFYVNITEILHVANAEYQFNFEVDETTLDGRIITLLLHWAVVPGFEHDLSKVIVTMIDITGLKQAEKQLTLQASALNASANAILITDAKGVIEWVNPSYEELTGYSGDEVIGKDPAFIRSGYQNDAFYDELWNTIDAGEVWRGELVNKRKDGSIYYEEQTITPLFNTDGAITHFIGIKQDISERKQNEKEIEKQNQELNVLYNAGRALSKSLDLQTIYNSFYQQISSVMKIDNLYISAFDKDSGMITASYAVAEGKPIDVANFPPIPLEPEGQGIQSPVIRSGKSLKINDFVLALKKTQSNYLINQDGAVVDETQVPEETPHTQSALVIPVILNDQVHGVVQIQSYEKDAYTDNDLALSESMVSQIAIAINNAQLYQARLVEIEARKQAEAAKERKNYLQEKIAGLSRDLTATHDRLYIFQTAQHYLKLMIDSPIFCIALFETNHPVLNPEYFTIDDVMVDPDVSPNAIYATQEVYKGWYESMSTKTPIIINNLSLKAYQGKGSVFSFENRPQSAFIAPMLAQNDVIGLLIIESRNNFAFLEEDKEWFGLVANQIGLAIQNARLFTHAQQRIAELSTIQVIDSALLSHLGHKQAYDLLTAQTAIQLKTDSAILLLYDETNQELHLASVYGYQKKKNISLNIKLGESLAGKVALERKQLHFDHLKNENLSLLVNETLNEGFDDYYGLPLITSGKLIGVLEVMHRTPIQVDEDWFRFLAMLAEQSAIVIDTIQLYDGIQLAHQELVKAYDATIEGWSQAMDLRDRETEGHTQRVVDLTLRLAHKFGFSEEDLVHIRRGCLLHDIGKLGVPDAILLKADKLTDEEWVLMKRHPEYAYSMLKPIEYLAPAIDIPYCHHEKWDGSGYPRGLKGEEIPLAGRLFAIVDVWDALLSNRPYRKAWTELQAFEYMKEQSGKQFDPRVVSTFLGMATKSLDPHKVHK